MDSLTHRITARVGFTDLEGYTSADSIAISESFAKRLTTYDEAILYLDKASNVYKLITKKKVKFDLYTLKQIFPERNDAILLSYQNVHISKIDDVDKKYARVFLAWEIPFRLGDKITNLHGAKGTVGFILPDKDMPKLTKKVGNMKAGPLDIIISGYSTIRRGSLGQIFEAWALASGIDYEGHDYIAEMMEKYSSQMKTYSKNSIVEYKGEKKVIPVGINYIMRLYHHASTHISVSSANTAFQKTLKFGEMEKLNLVANDCPNILLELGIRSIKKYIGSHKLVDEMERTRELPDRKDLNISLQFIEILKSMGYEMKIDKINKPTYDNMDEVDLNNVNSLFNTKGVEEDDNSDTTN
jgi:DNA-directed RNA polymerase beta subunit